MAPRQRCFHSSSQACLLLMLVLIACAQAFVPNGPSIVTKCVPFPTLAATDNNHNQEGGDESIRNNNNNNNNNQKSPDVGRRGTLMTLLGTAASFAMGDVALNAASRTASVVSASGAGLYERVLAFGRARGGAAIASEELTAWIASQSVARTPEIAAWLAAQKKLQLVRKSTVAATAALSRAKTARKATVAGGSILEEGMLAAAATAAVKAFSMDSNSDKEDMESSATPDISKEKSETSTNAKDTDDGE